MPDHSKDCEKGNGSERVSGSLFSGKLFLELIHRVTSIPLKGDTVVSKGFSVSLMVAS